MADHNFGQPVAALGGWGQLVECSWVTDGTNAPTGFTTDGGVTGVTRTGVGTFELTFAKSWKALWPHGLSVGGAAAAQTGRPSIRSVSASTRKVVIAMVESDAAPIDIETTGVTVYCAFRLRLG